MNYALTLFSSSDPSARSGDLATLPWDTVDQELRKLSLERKGNTQFAEQSAASSVVHTLLRATDESVRPLLDLRRSLIEISRTQLPQVDFVLQDLEEARTPKRLAVFDMDSTLIRAEVIDEYGRELGIYDQVSAITASAMRGEIDFNESFRRRMTLLKGLPEAQAHGIWERIEVTAGAEELFKQLKKQSITTALLSGGFTHIAEKVQDLLGIDTVTCNQMRFHESRCTGEALPPIVNAEVKVQELIRLRDRNGLERNETLAVGDGANDIPMLLEAGLGVAVHAKPTVVDSVGVTLRAPSLAPLVHLLLFPL